MRIPEALLIAVFVLDAVGTWALWRLRRRGPAWRPLAYGGAATGLVVLAAGLARLPFALLILDPRPPSPPLAGTLLLPGVLAFGVGWLLAAASLALSRDPERRLALGRRPVTVSALVLAGALAALAPAARDTWLAAKAGNRSTPPHVLRELYRHPRIWSDGDGLGRLARNPATPADVLIDLARRIEGMPAEGGQVAAVPDGWYLRRVIARRRSFPDGALPALAEVAASSLAAGGSAGFLFELLRNSELPLEVRWRLARHDSPAVRAVVAAHPDTPAEIIAELRQDEAPEVQQSLRFRADSAAR